MNSEGGLDITCETDPSRKVYTFFGVKFGSVRAPASVVHGQVGVVPRAARVSVRVWLLRRLRAWCYLVCARGCRVPESGTLQAGRLSVWPLEDGVGG